MSHQSPPASRLAKTSRACARLRRLLPVSLRLIARFPSGQPPNFVEPGQVEDEARHDGAQGNDNSPPGHGIRHVGDNGELVGHAGAVDEKPSDDKQQSEDHLYRAEEPGIAVAAADQKPAQVQKGGARLADDEPREHERAEVVSAGDDGAQQEGEVVQDGIEAAERGVLAEDVDQVCEEVGSEEDVGVEDAAGLGGEGEDGERQGGGQGRRRVLQLDVDRGVQQDA